MVGDQRVVFQSVPRHHSLRRRLLASGQGRCVGILRLFQLIGGDQILCELCLVAIELLFREGQPVFGGIERGLRTGCLILGIDGIEPRDSLSLMN